MLFEDRLGHSVPIRIAILGDRGVGKSALTVRFLTKRFIGDYRSDTDMLYKCSVSIEGASHPVEIMDTSPAADDVTEAHLQWADAFVLTYSITDKSSFNMVSHLLQVLSTHRPSCKVLVLGTKTDLNHLREVEEVEGRCLALSHSCRFSEVSSADDYASVASSFSAFLRDVKVSRGPSLHSARSLSSLKSSGVGNTSPKQRKMSVSRMLGSLIGRASPQQTPITQLIVLDRKEFSKNKVPIRHL